MPRSGLSSIRQTSEKISFPQEAGLLLSLQCHRVRRGRPLDSRSCDYGRNTIGPGTGIQGATYPVASDQETLSDATRTWEAPASAQPRGPFPWLKDAANGTLPLRIVGSRSSVGTVREEFLRPDVCRLAPPHSGAFLVRAGCQSQPLAVERTAANSPQAVYRHMHPVSVARTPEP